MLTVFDNDSVRRILHVIHRDYAPTVELRCRLCLLYRHSSPKEGLQAPVQRPPTTVDFYDTAATATTAVDLQLLQREGGGALVCMYVFIDREGTKCPKKTKKDL